MSLFSAAHWRSRFARTRRLVVPSSGTGRRRLAPLQKRFPAAAVCPDWSVSPAEKPGWYKHYSLRLLQHTTHVIVCVVYVTVKTHKTYLKSLQPTQIHHVITQFRDLRHQIYCFLQKSWTEIFRYFFILGGCVGTNMLDWKAFYIFTSICSQSIPAFELYFRKSWGRREAQL